VGSVVAGAVIGTTADFISVDETALQSAPVMAISAVMIAVASQNRLGKFNLSFDSINHDWY
jgi:hypothetical protein